MKVISCDKKIVVDSCLFFVLLWSIFYQCFSFHLQFIIAVVILVVAAYADAGGIPVVDVVSLGAPVGHHGPALVNHWGHWGSHLGGGLGGIGHLGGLVVGSPYGAPHIGLATTGLGHLGLGAGLAIADHGHGHHDG